MITRTLIQIVPLRSVSPEGVGDYARLIAEQLLSAHDICTVFVTGTILPPKDRLHDAWRTIQVAERSAQAMLNALAEAGGNRGDAILLHLSAYGYQDKGVPLWLLAALERWRQDNPATPLITVFHELYATGPVWRSAFWLGPIQAWIARRLQRISNAGIATTQLYANILKRWRGDRPGSITALPVFSTIGEMPTPPTIRSASLAVFGRAGIFKAIYLDGIDEIEAFVTANHITEIVDIGQRNEAPPATIGCATVRCMGQLPTADLQRELSRVRFGLLDYDADRLAKSTVFAAYCAHGAIPVCLSDNPGVLDGLEPGKNYVKLPAQAHASHFSGVELERLQSCATSWYRPHTLQATVDRIVGTLSPESNPADLHV